MGVFKVPASTLLDRMREEAGMRFRGRAVVVTGSGSGLGRHMAHRFAAEGTAVVVADVVERAAGEVADEISRARGRTLGYKAAVAEAEEVETMVKTARRELGPVDILIKNAAKATDRDFLDLDEEQWEDDVSFALKGSFLCSKT